MAEQNFPVEGPVTVHILEVRGDLEVVGWAEGRVSVVADEDEMPDAAWREGALTLRGGDDVTVYVPQGTNVEIERVAGDLDATNVGVLGVSQAMGDVEIHNAGTVAFGQIAGDCGLRNTGAVEGGQVRGDFEAHRVGDLNVGQLMGDAEIHQAGSVRLQAIMGDLEIHEAADVVAAQVMGDAEIEAVVGNVNLEATRGDVAITGATNVRLNSVNGDLSVADARGPVEVRHVNGDARLHGLAADQTHSVHTDGDVALGIGPGPLRLNLRAHGSIRWDRSLGLVVENGTRRPLVGRLGEGGGEITASAHGDAVVYMAGDDRGRRGRTRWAVVGAGAPGMPPVPPVPPVPPAPPMPTFTSMWGGANQRTVSASPEEREAILKLLSERKISAEQAARLLDALGG